jgi:hypothetical protein
LIETVSAIISGAALVTTLYGIFSNKYTAWKELQKWQQKRIAALKAETARNIDIIAEIRKEDLRGKPYKGKSAIHDPAIRKLIAQLSCIEAGKVSEDFDSILGRRLKKEAKNTAPENKPVRVFIAIREAALKIADLKARAGRAAKPTAHATRTILCRRIPAIQNRLDIIKKALAPVPANER